MKRKFRLNRENDIKRVRRYGRSNADPLFTLIACQNESEVTRIGIISSKSLGNAVKRNRARRRLRASSDGLFENMLPGWDVILVAKKAVIEAPFMDIQDTMTRLMKNAGILKSDGTGHSTAN